MIKRERGREVERENGGSDKEREREVRKVERER